MHHSPRTSSKICDRHHTILCFIAGTGANLVPAYFCSVDAVLLSKRNYLYFKNIPDMNQLAEVYKTYSDINLLRIIRQPDNYRPEAINAANAELKSRNLSEQTIQQAIKELEKENQKEYEETEVEQSEEQIIYRPNIQINAISVVFSLIAILQIVTQLDLITRVLTDPKWDFSVFVYFFPIIILPIACLLFWVRKPAGWMLMSIYLGYALMGFIWICFLSFNPAFLVASLFFSGTLWFICQQRVREAFSISTDKMYISLAVSIAIGIITPAIMYVL